MLGVPALFSAAYGNVGSSIYYALGVAALYALGLTPLSFVVAGLLFGATALTYAEGATAMPEAGGSSSFARRSFNELFSFVAAWAQALNYIVTMAISAFVVPHYLAVFLPILGTWPADSIAGVLVIAALAAVNIVGIKESSGVNLFLAIMDLTTQAAVVGLGIVFLLNFTTLWESIHWGEAPTWPRFFYGISISMIAYTGIETVANLAEETRNPSKNIPRSVIGVFFTVLIMYTLIPLVALSAMPVYRRPDGTWITDLGDKYVADPIVGVVQQLPGAYQTLLEAWVGILAATILIIATNAALLGISRLAYSMGRHQQLPAAVSRIHRQRRTPANAIVLFSLFAALLVLPGRVELLANVYSFGAMLSFTFAHASIIVLRIKEPDLPRPFRIPGNILIHGRHIPVTAVVGGLGTFITWLVVVYNQPEGRYIGFAWLAIGLILYLLYRRVIGQSPLKTVVTEQRRGP